jgi:hypothetical protein
MQLKHHESENKPHTRRGGKDNPPRGGPTRGSVTRGRVEPSADVRRAIYSGQDRLGSYRRVGVTFEAFDRLGRPPGTFPTEREAIAAIDPSEAP